jgi:hypothetical protein
MPELVARMAVQPSLGTVALHRVDKRLDLIRVSEDNEQGVSGQEMLAFRALLDRRRLRRRVTLAVSGLALVAVAGLVSLLAKFDASMPLLVAYDSFAVLLAGQVICWIGQRKRSVLALLANAALVAGAAWGLYHAPNAFMESHLAMPVIQFAWLIGFAFVIPHIPLLPVGLGHKAIRISLRQLESISMSWDASDAIAFHDLPRGLHCEGAAARTLGQKIFALAAQSGPTRPVFAKPVRSAEAAYQLLNGLGGLRGVLNALEGFRRDSDGRVLLADIPTVYLRALDLAYASTVTISEDFGLDRLADAQETAALAEGLDRENSG